MKLFRLVVFAILVFCVASSSFSQNWDQIIKICASDRQGEDNYGCSVAISGDYAVVGANYEDHDENGENHFFESGSAYILKNIDGSWTEIQKIVASDRASEDWFGTSVDICGDYIVVGAYKEDEDEFGNFVVGGAGSAYIFKNEGGVWTQVQKIVASDRQPQDHFGYSVAISDDYIVVGAPDEDDNSGSAYIFYNNSGTWQEVQKIVASDRAANDYFGFSVDIDGDYIIIGASYEDEDENGSNTINCAGSAYIFKNIAGNWTETQKIVASDRDELDWFGWSVAINGSYAIVGAYHEADDEYGNNPMIEAGSAYIFYNNSDTWTEVNKLVAADREEGDRFGWAVAISGDYAIVGAYCEDENVIGTDSLMNAGSAYIFKNIEGNWTQEQKIVSNDRGLADYFGISLDIDETYILVGAKLEDSDPFGHFIFPEAGAAYVFYNCREINVRQDITQIADGGSYDFGVIPYGESSDGIIFTIENTGVNELLLSGDPKIEIAGTNASAFNINQSLVNSSILPGEATTFSIVFTPSFTDIHTAEISISNNDTDENPYNFTISGSGGKLPQSISGFEPISEKTYGDDPFEVSATASSGLDVIFTSSDDNIATCTGTNGSTITIINAGTCQIFANQPGNEIYLPAEEVPQTLVVNTKHIDITVNAGQFKYYGDTDPLLNFTVIPSLVPGDAFTGNLSRIEGEEIGSYEIQQGDLSAGPNYDVTFYSDNFEILVKPITITVDPGQSKIYGQQDPVFTYTFDLPLASGDEFTGSLSREPGEDVGTYEIQMGTLALSSNYEINFISSLFDITLKTITVTVNSEQFKIYGETDPVFTYSFTPALVLGDSFTGALSREEGEDVGLYEIAIGTLDLGDNYNIIFNADYFEILNRLITIYPYPNQYKSYGQDDPELVYYSVPDPVNGDEFSGTLSRVSGENPGFYAIQLGSLSLNENYIISLVPEHFEIKKQNIVVIVDEGQMKEYGQNDPDVFTYTTSGNLAVGDSFSGYLIREPGEDVGHYSILQGSLSLNSNYIISFIGEDFEITTKQITVIADPNQAKVYGETDPPVFTYSVSGTLLNDDEFSGELARNMGETVGDYYIYIGSLSLGSNYNLIYEGDYFHITPKEIIVIADESQSKLFGEQDPVFTYSFTGELESWDNFTGQLSREQGEDVGLYEIQQGSLAINYNYDINFISSDFEITKAAPQIIWDNPADIYYGTPLSEIQLNASANIVGTFEYNPDFETVLEIGNNQELHVLFVPDDYTNYNNAQATVFINVLLGNAVIDYERIANVYPNPTTGLLMINYSDCTIDEVLVIDILGEVLIEETFSNQLITVNLSKLPAGTYIVIIKTSQGVITEKVIKW